MTAVDTHILVRFLVRDDEAQAEAVRKRFKQAERARDRFLVPMLVVLEAIWVLESAYAKTRSEILGAVEDMRQMPVLKFEADAVLDRLLHDGRKYKADLADILIAHSARASGCETGITFDKAAARLPFFRLLK